MSNWLRRIRRIAVFRILHADDTPHQIAMGAAIGLFIAMTPTIGVQMFVALLAATAMKANKVISMAMVWISNPVTMLWIYYWNWRIGQKLVKTSMVDGESAVQAKIQEIADSIGGMTNLASHMFDGSFWSKVLGLVWSLGVELWIGSFIVGAGCAIPGYFLTLWLVGFYRQRFPRPRFFRKRSLSARERACLKTSRPRLRQDSPSA